MESWPFKLIGNKQSAKCMPPTILQAGLDHYSTTIHYTGIGFRGVVSQLARKVQRVRAWCQRRRSTLHIIGMKRVVHSRMWDTIMSAPHRRGGCSGLGNARIEPPSKRSRALLLSLIFSQKRQFSFHWKKILIHVQNIINKLINNELTICVHYIIGVSTILFVKIIIDKQIFNQKNNQTVDSWSV